MLSNDTFLTDYSLMNNWTSAVQLYLEETCTYVCRRKKEQLKGREQ